MRGQLAWLATPVAFVIATLVLSPQARSENVLPSGERLRISISSSLFGGTSESLVAAVMKPFEALMIAQTGMGGEVISVGNGEAVARHLMEGKIQLGVIEGIEYAWLKRKYPQLRPLMITINHDIHPRACLVARKDREVDAAEDLQGKILVELKESRQYCRLFRDRLFRQDPAVQANQFFSQIVTVQHAEAALDDVVDDRAHAAILDTVSFGRIQRRKPGRAGQLEIIDVSEAFPASVIIYREGAIDGTRLQRFQQGMLNANKNILGQQLLTMWKLTAFAPVPRDFEQVAAQIIETYPESDLWPKPRAIPTRASAHAEPVDGAHSRR